MKPYLILIEGMALAKRGEVAKYLQTRLVDCELYVCNEKTPLHLFVPMMMDVLQKNKHVIIENGWRADYVYRETSDWKPRPLEFRRMLDRIALGCNAVVGACIGTEEAYRTHLNPDLMRAALAIHERWKELDLFGLRRTLVHSWTDYSDDIDLLLDKALLYSGENKGPGIGAWRINQSVLMVGDRHGPSIQPYQTTYNLAFCDMAKAGSSYWLTQQLELGGVREDRLYWINAYDKEGVPTEPGFIERLKPLAIFALGDSAAKWCSSNGLQFEHFTHPQYHKRFEHHKPYSVIERLKEVLK